MEYLVNCTSSSPTNLSWDCENTGILCNGEVCGATLYKNDSPPVPDIAYVQFRESSRFWIQRVLVPIITMIGVIGNTITIVIMTRRRMRSSTNNYLAALASCDMLYLAGVFTLSFKHYDGINSPSFSIYWWCFPFIIMLTDECSNTSVWLTVTFTIERYIAVCHPIRGKVLCTESRSKRVIIAVFVFCFLFTLPTLFEYSYPQEKFNAENNQTIITLPASDLADNQIYRTVYYWLTVVFFTLIPFLLLAIFNSFLVRSVHLSQKQRSTMTRKSDSSRDTSRQENKITVMLIAVVILFFICQLPTAVTLLYTSFRQIEWRNNEGLLMQSLGNIFNFLMSINAAGNFILYCLLSQKYRRTFVQIFCPCIMARLLRLHSAYQHNATTYTHVDESPSMNRRLSNRSVRSTTSGSGDHSQEKPAQKPCYLSVPGSKSNETAETADAQSDKASASDKNSVKCGSCSLWQKLRIGTKNNSQFEHVIPLQGTKDCVVIITSDGLSHGKCLHSSL